MTHDPQDPFPKLTVVQLNAGASSNHNKLTHIATAAVKTPMNKICLERFGTLLTPTTPDGYSHTTLEMLIHKELLPYVDRLLREGKMEQVLVQAIEELKFVDTTRGLS